MDPSIPLFYIYCKRCVLKKINEKFIKLQFIKLEDAEHMSIVYPECRVYYLTPLH